MHVSFGQAASTMLKTPAASKPTKPANHQAELTMLISSQKWPAVEKLLKKIMRNAEDSTKPVFGLYLLHLALRSMAPLSIIAVLLDTSKGGNPLSISTPESSTGMLPLHLACRYGASAAIVDVILLHYPSAADVKDEAGKTAKDYAKNPTSPQPRTAEIKNVLNRAGGYQTIADMVQRRAAAEMEERWELMQAKMEQTTKERDRLQQQLESIPLFLNKKGVELERSKTGRRNRQADADEPMINQLGQLKQELYATRKATVVQELEAMSAKGTAHGLKKNLLHAIEDLDTARKGAANNNTPPSLLSSFFGNSAQDEAVAAATSKINQLEVTISLKEEEGVQLARRVVQLERLLQKANATIEGLSDRRQDEEAEAMLEMARGKVTNMNRRKSNDTRSSDDESSVDSDDYVDDAPLNFCYSAM
jgi:hypothetical protein